MAIRQEIYTIYVQPSLKIKNGSKDKDIPIYLGKDAEIYMRNTFITGTNQPAYAKIAGENTNGIWKAVFSSNSYAQIRVKYKELLKTMGKEYIRVEKKVPIDTLVIPNS